MKMRKSIYSLACALAVALGATGCKHEPVPITPIPGPNAPMIGNNSDLNTIPNTIPNNQVNSQNSQNNEIAATPLSEFENMLEDRAALAPYTIHFGFDSAAIRNSEQANLQAVARALNADQSTKLLIEGNCDERGTEEYNRALGERRAQAARQALVQMGIDPSRIRTISYGKDKPVDPAHNPTAWAKNRRDDFVLLRPKSGV